ncbi:pseudouridine synthase [Cellulomonas timonensis]|uniref:pseudouridine synthase n=1 Tax=Cellulomonas timonensis TaxID=1689271 RepID=UPI0008325C93|nr:pseudouridine synthase [Cellulomonas timonensis]
MSTEGRRGGAAGAGRGRDGGGRAGAPRGAGGGRSGQQRPARAGQPGRPARAKAPARAAEPPRDVHDPEGVRLQKVLATAGLGSRRACEDLITAGRVTVDGVPVIELGVRVDPAKVAIHVDGMRVQLDTSMVTIALNKPLGVVSTMHDPDGRPSLAEFVKNREERLFHVGRLDAETEGLILLTNDGELANRLAHPSHEVPKTYFAELEGRVHPSLGKQLQKGIELEDGLVTVDSFRIVDQTAQASLVELVLHEGRNRVVRRIFEEVGFPVTRLVRTQIGPIKLGDLRPGRTRVLGKTELGTLMALVGM